MKIIVFISDYNYNFDYCVSNVVKIVIIFNLKSVKSKCTLFYIREEFILKP